MTASIQEKNGWLYVVVCYTDELGDKKYKWINTKLKRKGNMRRAKEMIPTIIAQQQAELDNKINKLDRRKNPDKAWANDAKLPFSQYLKKYVESIKDRLSPQVYYNYSDHYMKVFEEYFDKKKLRLIDIDSDEIMNFYAFLRARGLKEVSIKHYSNVVRPAITMAYKRRIIPDNPYDFVPPLHREKPIINFYNKEESEQLLEAIKGHPLELAIKIALYYGLRKSELIGLRWSSIDFNHNMLTINHKIIKYAKEIYASNKLKTSSSYRTLPLIPSIKHDLLCHKAEIKRNREYYGMSYITAYEDYVFVNQYGKLINPDYLQKQFKKLIKEKGLKPIRFHDLRHSCASMMLAEGVSIKQIQEWLGHSNFNTTADIYSHLDTRAKLQSADTLAKALDLGISQDIHALGEEMEGTLGRVEENDKNHVEDVDIA